MIKIVVNMNRVRFVVFGIVLKNNKNYCRGIGIDQVDLSREIFMWLGIF